MSTNVNLTGISEIDFTATGATITGTVSGDVVDLDIAVAPAAGFQLTPPPGGGTTGWSWLSQSQNGSTNTVDNTNDQIVLTHNGGGENIAGRIRTKAGSTFTIIAACSHVGAGLNDATHYNGSGILLTDGTKMALFGLLVYNGGIGLLGNYWTNNTTFSTTITNFGNPFSALPFVSPYMFLKIQETASDRIFSISPNLRSWAVIATVGKTEFLTTASYGVFIRALNTNAYSCCASFTESTP